MGRRIDIIVRVDRSEVGSPRKEANSDSEERLSQALQVLGNLHIAYTYPRCSVRMEKEKINKDV